MLERLKTVRELARYVQHPAILGGQFNAEAPPKSRRTPPQIDNCIVDTSHVASHQLGLFKRRYLIVHAAQGPLSLVEGDVALRYLYFKAVLGKFPLAKGTREKASIVFSLFQIDYKCPFKKCFDEHQFCCSPEI